MKHGMEIAAVPSTTIDSTSKKAPAVIIKCATYVQYDNVLAMYLLIPVNFILVLWHNRA